MAIEFGKYWPVTGFDINKKRIEELKLGVDRTKESSQSQIKNSKELRFSYNIDEISKCNVYVVTVPTPIDKYKTPDLAPLKRASEMLSKIIKPKDIIIYESTVFPGCTEEVCVPILESGSKLVFNKDFFCGYSPERIVPGDKVNTLTTIKKVTSGSNEETADFVDELYGKIIKPELTKHPALKLLKHQKQLKTHKGI